RALKFYSSVRIDVRRVGQLKDGEEVVGQRVRAKVVKNKIAPPFRAAEFDMMHSNGISFEGDVLDLGTENRVVQKSGSWFKYGDVHLGQGKEKARQFLIENPQITQEIKQRVLASSDGYVAPLESTSDSQDED
ncbi:MAG TPA: DNA recombination/repair protein RecA, partial [Pirellulaceae bacterium]